MTDLLTIKDREAPMGDVATRQSLSFCRAIWTSPLAGEEGAPRRRIIHARALQLHTPAKLTRLGLQRSIGYHKCGSRQDLDWVTAFRILVWDGKRWSLVRSERDVARPGDSPAWFELDSVETTAVLIEARSVE